MRLIKTLAIDGHRQRRLAFRASVAPLRPDGFVESPALGVDDGTCRPATVRAKLHVDAVEPFSAIASFTYAQDVSAQGVVPAEAFPDDWLNI